MHIDFVMCKKENHREGTYKVENQKIELGSTDVKGKSKV